MVFSNRISCDPTQPTILSRPPTFDQNSPLPTKVNVNVNMADKKETHLASVPGDGKTDSRSDCSGDSDDILTIVQCKQPHCLRETGRLTMI